MAEKKKKEKKPSTMLDAPKTDKLKSIANKIFEIVDLLEKEEANKNAQKEKLVKLAATLRKKEMQKRFIKSVKVFGNKERHLLLEFKNSFFQYDISEVKLLKNIFGDLYKSLFDEIRNQVNFQKKITMKDLKEFFGKDKKKMLKFEEKFIDSNESYVKPNNKFQEEIHKLKKQFTKKQNERAQEIYEDATHSVTMKVNP